jgi:hypothetical protein
LLICRPNFWARTGKIEGTLTLLLTTH